MSRKEIKAKAREQLGGSIFHNNWLIAIVVELIYGAIITALSPTAVGTIIVAGPLTYGLTKLFLKQAADKKVMSIVDLFDGFKDDFGGTVGIGFMTALYTFLWSLLLFIPGIVKSYSYSMAMNIKCDHNDYGWKQCITESRQLMNGHKMDLFVLDLSFIGWYIVGALCFGVGTLWVTEYHQAARTQFYRSLVPGTTAEATEF
ncbi:MAG: DUF975 family protein [Clostridia bacterium]|nr:DUF975 family protein [Clostridia bacterium]